MSAIIVVVDAVVSGVVDALATADVVEFSEIVVVNAVVSGVVVISSVVLVEVVLEVVVRKIGSGPLTTNGIPAWASRLIWAQTSLPEAHTRMVAPLTGSLASRVMNDSAGSEHGLAFEI